MRATTSRARFTGPHGARVARPATATALALVGCLALAPFAPASLAHAAEATQDEATRLRALFEGFVGAPTPGEPGVVTVTPKGESYEVVLDFDRLAAPLAGLGITAKFGRNVSLLTPLADGTWKHVADGFDPITFEGFGQSGRFLFEGFKGEGIFDPRLGAFTSTTATAARVVAEQTVVKTGDDPRFDIRKIDEAMRLSATAVPAASGSGIDGTIVQTWGPMVETFTLSDGLAKGVPDMEATLKIAATRVDSDLRGVKPREILDLWSHLVKHHEPIDFTNGQSTLKARIAAVLPLFERLRHSGTLDGIELETPVGFGSIRRLSVTADLTGATRDGVADIAYTMEGLELHSLFLPAWGARLVPADLTVKGRVAGYDVGTAVTALLESADFADQKPLSPEAEARIKALLLPRGTVEVVVDGNHAKSALYDLTVDGRFTAGPEGAKGAVTVRATGVEATIDALSDPKAGAEAKKAADELRQAVAMAEKTEDALVWRFDFDGEAVSVNGKPIGPTAKPADEAPSKAVPAEPIEPAPKNGGKKPVDNKPKKI